MKWTVEYRMVDLGLFDPQHVQGVARVQRAAAVWREYFVGINSLDEEERVRLDIDELIEILPPSQSDGRFICIP